ncbi:MAG: undecaprenyl-diphosphate phosphatase [Alphaproteobacteria bacterium]|nr:undecaprenyl-diphosphate phosphatase [Alphaproteobacteria bacterium]
MTEQILLIALIQGITEFLPISSSGHLNLLHNASRYDDPGLAMDVAVHVGTVIAVIAYNWRDIKRMTLSVLTGGRHHRDQLGVSVSAIIATIPTVVIGYWLNAQGHLIDLLRNVEVIAWATLIFGIILGVADQSRGHRRFVTVNISDAVVIGFAQVLAFNPGTSRSGITMTAARAIGLSRRAAARFSMILSIPVILGSGLLKGREVLAAGQTDVLVPMLIAAFIAMVVAFLSISAMMAIIQRIGFMPFVIYRVVIGVILLASVYAF